MRIEPLLLAGIPPWCCVDLAKYRGLPPSQLILGGFHRYVGRAVVIITDVYLPRSTTHLTVLDVGLDGPAGRIDVYGHVLPAVRAAHLDLGVPGVQLGRLERRFRIFRSRFVNRITQRDILFLRQPRLRVVCRRSRFCPHNVQALNHSRSVSNKSPEMPGP